MADFDGFDEMDLDDLDVVDEISESGSRKESGREEEEGGERGNVKECNGEVVVEGIPPDTTPTILKKLFPQAIDINLPDTEDGYSAGYAILVLASMEEARNLVSQENNLRIGDTVAQLYIKKKTVPWIKFSKGSRVAGQKTQFFKGRGNTRRKMYKQGNRGNGRFQGFQKFSQANYSKEGFNQGLNFKRDENQYGGYLEHSPQYSRDPETIPGDDLNSNSISMRNPETERSPSRSYPYEESPIEDWDRREDWFDERNPHRANRNRNRSSPADPDDRLQEEHLGSRWNLQADRLPLDEDRGRRREYERPMNRYPDNKGKHFPENNTRYGAHFSGSDNPDVQNDNDDFRNRERFQPHQYDKRHLEDVDFVRDKFGTDDIEDNRDTNDQGRFWHLRRSQSRERRKNGHDRRNENPLKPKPQDYDKVVSERRSKLGEDFRDQLRDNQSNRRKGGERRDSLEDEQLRYDSEYPAVRRDLPQSGDLDDIDSRSRRAERFSKPRQRHDSSNRKLESGDYDHKTHVQGRYRQSKADRAPSVAPSHYERFPEDKWLKDAPEVSESRSYDRASSAKREEDRRSDKWESSSHISSRARSSLRRNRDSAWQPPSPPEKRKRSRSRDTSLAIEDEEGLLVTRSFDGDVIVSRPSRSTRDRSISPDSELMRTGSIVTPQPVIQDTLPSEGGIMLTRTLQGDIVLSKVNNPIKERSPDRISVVPPVLPITPEKGGILLTRTLSGDLVVANAEENPLDNMLEIPSSNRQTSAVRESPRISGNMFYEKVSNDDRMVKPFLSTVPKRGHYFPEANQAEFDEVSVTRSPRISRNPHQLPQNRPRLSRGMSIDREDTSSFKRERSHMTDSQSVMNFRYRDKRPFDSASYSANLVEDKEIDELANDTRFTKRQRVFEKHSKKHYSKDPNDLRSSLSSKFDPVDSDDNADDFDSVSRLVRPLSHHRVRNKQMFPDSNDLRITIRSENPDASNASLEDIDSIDSDESYHILKGNSRERVYAKSRVSHKESRRSAQHDKRGSRFDVNTSDSLSRRQQNYQVRQTPFADTALNKNKSSNPNWYERRQMSPANVYARSGMSKSHSKHHDSSASDDRYFSKQDNTVSSSVDNNQVTFPHMSNVQTSNLGDKNVSDWRNVGRADSNNRNNEYPLSDVKVDQLMSKIGTHSNFSYNQTETKGRGQNIYLNPSSEFMQRITNTNQQVSSSQRPPWAKYEENANVDRHKGFGTKIPTSDAQGGKVDAASDVADVRKLLINQLQLLQQGVETDPTAIANIAEELKRLGQQKKGQPMSSHFKTSVGETQNFSSVASFSNSSNWSKPVSSTAGQRQPLPGQSTPITTPLGQAYIDVQPTYQSHLFSGVLGVSDGNGNNSASASQDFSKQPSNSVYQTPSSQPNVWNNLLNPLWKT